MENKKAFDWASFLILENEPFKYVIFMGGIKVVNNQKIFELFVYNVSTRELELCDSNNPNINYIYEDIRQLVIDNYEKRDIIKEILYEHQLKNKKPFVTLDNVPEINCSIDGLGDTNTSPIFLNIKINDNLQEYSGDKLEKFIDNIMKVYFEQPKFKDNGSELTPEIEHGKYLN